MASTTNYDVQDRGPGLIIFNMVMMALTILIIGLRFLSRAVTPRPNNFTSRFWWDDWLALAAAPFVIASHILSIPQHQLGLGKHVSQFQFRNLVPIWAIFVSEYYLCIIGSFLARESAIFFLSRIFSRNSTSKWFAIGLNIIHASNVAWAVCFLVLTSNLCYSVEKILNPLLPGHCFSKYQLLVPHTLTEMVLDIIVLVSPMPKIYWMHMSWKQKVGIGFIFLLGYSTVIVSIGRAVSTLRLSGNVNSDSLYEVVPSLYWFFANSSVTLISVCIPAIIALGRHIRSWYGTQSKLAEEVSRVGNTQNLSRTYDTESQKHMMNDASHDLQAWNTDATHESN